LFYQRPFYRTPAWRLHRAATQGPLTIRHVDNTGDRVKFRRSTVPRAVMLRKQAASHGKGEFDGA
jgi:hypothetical protein